MRLRPNPPRLIAGVIALALGVIGFAVVWPVGQLVSLLNMVNVAAARELTT
jgi:hypothetical protein